MTLPDVNPESGMEKGTSKVEKPINPEVTAADNHLLIAWKRTASSEAISNAGLPRLKLEDLDNTDQEDARLERKDGNESEVVVSEQMKKRVADLIEKLGDEEYEVREGAQAEIVRIGSPAFNQLQEAKVSNPELEVRRRVNSAMRQIINERPAALRAMGELKLDGLAEIGMTGRVSKETREKYEKFIKDANDLKMSPSERKQREELANKDFPKPVARLPFPLQAQFDDQKDFSKTPEVERAATREKFSLRAMRMDPASQARMDYADLLIASGDKKTAVKVLTEAVTKNPNLGKHSESDTFQKLARESGALTDKTFNKAVDAATGKENTTKDWNDFKIYKMAQDVGYLEEQSARFGMTKQLERQWDKLLTDLEQRAAKEPDQRKFLEEHLERSRMKFVEHLSASGMTEKANQMLCTLLKADPEIGETAWFRKVARMNEMKETEKVDQAKPTLGADGTPQR